MPLCQAGGVWSAGPSPSSQPALTGFAEQTRGGNRLSHVADRAYGPVTGQLSAPGISAYDPGGGSLGRTLGLPGTVSARTKCAGDHEGDAMTDSAERALPPKSPDVADEAEPSIEEVTLPADAPKELVDIVVKTEREASRVKLAIGILLCVAGLVLIILGYSGSVSWTITGADISSNLQTGSLGIVVLVAGVIVVWLSKIKINVTGASGSGGASANSGTGTA